MDAPHKPEDYWFKSIPPAQQMSRQELIAVADLVVFDPDTISGPADYNRLADPRGVDYVLVNGRVVAKYGKVEARFSGRVIRKRNESPLNLVEKPPTPLEQKAVDPLVSKRPDAVSGDTKKREKERTKPAHKMHKIGKSGRHG